MPPGCRHYSLPRFRLGAKAVTTYLRPPISHSHCRPSPYERSQKRPISSPKESSTIRAEPCAQTHGPAVVAFSRQGAVLPMGMLQENQKKIRNGQLSQSRARTHAISALHLKKTMKDMESYLCLAHENKNTKTSPPCIGSCKRASLPLSLPPSPINANNRRACHAPGPWSLLMTR